MGRLRATAGMAKLSRVRLRRNIPVLKNGSKKRKKISVVTGGAGFLGSHLVDLLLQRGQRVVAIDDLVTGGAENLAHLAGHPGFLFIQQDVTNFIFLDGPVDYVW